MKNLILSGGGAHDFRETSIILSTILEKVGITSEIDEDLKILDKKQLMEFDLITLNCMKFALTKEKNSRYYDEWFPSSYCLLSDAAKNNLIDFFAIERGLLGLHTATICFDNWDEFSEILGARWVWGASSHAPVQNHTMIIKDKAHAITKGLEDFVMYDELYMYSKMCSPFTTLVEADWEKRRHPIMWVKSYKNARICYNALGHEEKSFQNRGFQTLIQRSALWICTRGVVGPSF
ncbi:MAG: hypothetical protein A2350_07215 [Candidatus Raymondbacteria bacterium RifOxyB12_full_50_8]|nr:MAG: hypothetical protein A2350_07215 [Candidatus Raymondbacteria bacterium RifOxyB12_full_50_8]